MYKRNAIVVTSWPGQPGCGELERLAAADEGARNHYVELARTLQADVIDSHFMAERSTWQARLVMRRAGMVAGQVAEAALTQRRYQHIVAWADRIGLPLAFLFKTAHSRRDLVLISAWLSRRQKAVFLSHLKVHSHLKAIINYSSMQMQIAANKLDVPHEKLHLALQPVDEQFWRPMGEQPKQLICAVGSEARDYATFINAVKGIDVDVEIAIGSSVLARTDEVARPLHVAGLPPNVRVLQDLNHTQLRQLYCRSRFVVVPLQDVDSDCGVTVIAEAMAMGKAVIVSRSRGQIDLIRDGEQGIYVRPGDPSALRAAIEYLSANPNEAERMGRAGRALVEKRLTLDQYVAQLAEIVLADGPASEQSGLIRSP